MFKNAPRFDKADREPCDRSQQMSQENKRSVAIAHLPDNSCVTDTGIARIGTEMFHLLTGR